MAKITRRNFIKTTGAASAIGLAGFPAIASAMKHGGGKKVVVVGGGIGGATCARYIKMADAGIDVTLIEPKANYHTCFMSNEVLGGDRPIDSIKFGYDRLASEGINVIKDTVSAIDTNAKKVTTSGGKTMGYDRCVVAPGIDFKYDLIEGYDAKVAQKVPHAWQAGPQTATLRKQLEGMKNGGTVVICPPPNPFRCPPGPYERASLIAKYLQEQKPKSKILILDAKAKFSKQGLFTQGWKKLYGYGTDKSLIDWVSAEQTDNGIASVDAGAMTVTTKFGDTHKADVLNVIPAQKAGKIAFAAGLTKGDWCPVDKGTFESTIAKGVHVIGDASIATKMPKSGYSANSQAKVCAAAIVAMLNGDEPGTPSWINTCYSIVGKDYGMSVAAVYRLGKDAKGGQLITPVKGAGGLTPKDASPEHLRREVGYAHSWFNNITKDVFG